jgi:hypothetical protein
MSNTRTKEQRQSEVRIIIKKLNDLKLDIGYEPIKTLFENMKKYINDGIKIDVNIPFPDISMNIKGVLEIDSKKKVWVKLEGFVDGDSDDEE